MLPVNLALISRLVSLPAWCWLPYFAYVILCFQLEASSKRRWPWIKRNKEIKMNFSVKILHWRVDFASLFCFYQSCIELVRLEVYIIIIFSSFFLVSLLLSNITLLSWCPFLFATLCDNRVWSPMNSFCSVVVSSDSY
jgi:hypothetical protein